MEDRQLCRAGLGRAGQWLRLLKVAARVAQEKTGEGEYEVIEWPAPSPLFISLRWPPKSHFTLNFASIANLAKPASLPALQKIFFLL